MSVASESIMLDMIKFKMLDKIKELRKEIKGLEAKGVDATQQKWKVIALKKRYGDETISL